MQTTQNIQSSQRISKYLVYAAFCLLIVNFLLIFFPFIEIYQPSYKVTTFGGTVYEDWHTDRAPMTQFVIPIYFTGIPYLCSIISLAVSWRNKKSINNLVKIKNNTFTKPIRFFWLKAASIINLITMSYVFNNALNSVASLVTDGADGKIILFGILVGNGAYAKITLFGFLNFVCTFSLVVILFVLSRKTKSMFRYIKLETMAPSEPQQMDEAGNIEAKENEEQ